LRIPLPPLEEQKSIADHLTAIAKRDAAVREWVERSTALLHEYRTALISAAVTGKIDVRKEVA
jgi:hypothetical protein